MSRAGALAVAVVSLYLTTVVALVALAVTGHWQTALAVFLFPIPIAVTVAAGAYAVPSLCLRIAARRNTRRLAAFRELMRAAGAGDLEDK